MKKIIAMLTLLATFSSFATSIFEDLSEKKCSIQFNKTLFLRDSDEMTSFGRVTFAPLINESNLLLKKGVYYSAADFDEDIITLYERDNLVFVCITDETQECVKLSTVDSASFSEISNNQLKLVCE